MFNKRTIILFAAEIAAVMALRLVYIIKRDKLLLPRASKVPRINQRPVFRQTYTGGNPQNLERKIRDVEIQGWTPSSRSGSIRNTPDSSPDA